MIRGKHGPIKNKRWSYSREKFKKGHTRLVCGGILRGGALFTETTPT